ncbi:Hypothetical_protein [Hexamita inflata]|uniref:Hypothetical_protein n=1 Tax=Hexamita inflata TaxID=28002 RepID=A0AA86PT92_9EUKA|nr:Hypothetical protein HINF_LOCUS32188 [Hexamita inflata]
MCMYLLIAPEEVSYSNTKFYFNIIFIYSYLIQHEYPNNEQVGQVELDKFSQVEKFWNVVQKCHPEEMYWKNIDQIVARQVDYRSCSEGQGIAGRLFGKPIIEVEYKAFVLVKKKEKK